MHKSYCIRDGCRNCGACIVNYDWYGKATLYCALDKDKHPDPHQQYIEFMKWLDDLDEVMAAGKCDEWRALK